MPSRIFPFSRMPAVIFFMKFPVSAGTVSKNTGFASRRFIGIFLRAATPPPLESTK